MSAATLARVQEVIAKLALSPQQHRAQPGNRPGSQHRSRHRRAGDSTYLFPAIATMEAVAGEAGYGVTLFIGTGCGGLAARAVSSRRERQVAGVLVVSLSSGEFPSEDSASLRGIAAFPW